MTRNLPTVLLILLFGASSLSAQTAAPAAKPRSCGPIDNIGGTPSNPFTARRVHEPDNSSGPRSSTILTELVARDSSGRTRVEKRPMTKSPDGKKEAALYTRDGNEWTVAQEELGIVIQIFDCPNGKVLTIEPASRIALSRDLPERALSSSAADHPYSYYFTSTLRGGQSTSFRAEDLGVKEIAGIPARGVRTTSLGTDDDEWKGKPISIHEIWVSDDLAVTMVSYINDLKRGIAGTTRLVDIKREEPDPKLFQIPAEFKINPTPSEMPRQSATGRPQFPGPKP